LTVPGVCNSSELSIARQRVVIRESIGGCNIRFGCGFLGLFRLRSGPFEGPATEKPPALPEDGYSPAGRSAGGRQTPRKRHSRETAPVSRALKDVRLPLEGVTRVRSTQGEPTRYRENRQEIPAVQNVSIQKASELPQAMRSGVEQLLGRAIAPDEEIS